MTLGHALISAVCVAVFALTCYGIYATIRDEARDYRRRKAARDRSPVHAAGAARPDALDQLEWIETEMHARTAGMDPETQARLARRILAEERHAR